MSRNITLDRQGLPLYFYRRPEDGETVAVTFDPVRYDTPRGVETVPSDFGSDGCSLPRWFWVVFGHPFDMMFLPDALKHDWDYDNQHIPRAQADIEFRDRMRIRANRQRMEIMLAIYGEFPAISHKEFLKEYRKRCKKAHVMEDWRINGIYCGLYWFGWVAWNRHKRDNQNQVEKETEK